MHLQYTVRFFNHKFLSRTLQLRHIYPFQNELVVGSQELCQVVIFHAS